MRQQSCVRPGVASLSELLEVLKVSPRLDSFLLPAVKTLAPGHADQRRSLGVGPSCVHGGDGHVGVEHGVLLDVVVLEPLVLGGGVKLEPLVLDGGVDLVHVSPTEGLDDLEPPGVLWVLG